MAVQNIPNEKTNYKLIYNNKTFWQNKRLKYLIANFLYRIAPKAEPKTKEALAVVLYRNLSKKNFDRELLRELDSSDRLREFPSSDRLRELPSSDRLRELPSSDRLRELPSSDRLRELPSSENIKKHDGSYHKQLYASCLRVAVRTIMNVSYKKKYQANYFYNTDLDKRIPDRIFCEFPVFAKQNFHFYNLSNLQSGSLLARIKSYERRNNTSPTNKGFNR